MKQLPEVVYIARQNEGTEDEYLNVNAEAIEAIEEDGPTIVGTYQLKEVNELSKTVASKPVKP